MKKQLKTLKQIEDHRARICLEMICAYMKTQSEELSTKEVALVGFQQRIGSKILSPNENQEYERYRRKYRENRKLLQEKRLQAKKKTTINLSKD